MKFGASVLIRNQTQTIPELSWTDSHVFFFTWQLHVRHAESSNAVAWPKTEEKHKLWAGSRQRRMSLCPSPPLSDPSWLLDHPRAFLHSLTHGQGQQWGLLLSARLFAGCMRCPGQDQDWGPRFLCSLVCAVPQQQGNSGAWAETIWKGDWFDRSADANPALPLNCLTTDIF